MDKKKKVSYAAAIILVLTLNVASFAVFAKNDNAQNDKSNKASQSQKETKEKTAEMKNFAKPDTAKGETNAQLHKVKSEEVAKKLKEVAVEEEAAGNVEVSEQVEQVAVEQAEIQAETTEAIEEIETRGAVKTFLIGTDYKNLGQLRSNLVQNRNEIRKLTRTMTQAQTPESAALIQAQLMTMTQERERIKSVITTNEEGFSLFGWVAKFLIGYEATPINEEEEDQLAEEVVMAIENAPAENPVVTTEATEAPAATEIATEAPATTTETVPVQ